MISTSDKQALVLEQNIIEVRNLEFHYGRNKAVDNLSFSIGKGEILGLIGKNGAGKTTTIHLLLGFLNCHKGKIKVVGFDPKYEKIEILDRCGVFPEQGEPYHWMRVKTLFKMGQYSYSNWDRTLCDKLSEQFELNQQKRINELSKGMLVKTKLIFALSHRPEVLFLDEPTNGLDPLSRYDILSLIKQLSMQHKITVLISSHNLDEVAEIASQICIIDKGKDLLMDSMDAIKSKYTLIEVSNNATVPESLCRRAIRSRKNDNKIQYLFTDQDDPSIAAFIADDCKDGIKVIKLGLKELFIFITTRNLV